MARGLQWTPERLAAYQKRGMPRGNELHRSPGAINKIAPPAPTAATPAPAKRKNKYGAEKTATGDSRKESRRLAELRLLQAAGKIHALIPHVTYLLIPKQIKADGSSERAVKYTCDAQYIEGGMLVVEDSKSVATRKARDWQLRRKLMLERYGITIREV